ncbi:Hypothetical predicted protein [Olea europaea subsp. europaea]|uniref:Uncharacterized protein n=1 Tax=Olea europaea subsp. europaea TaxID=158383 RepID=A0A8S0TH09_OLEEU|nr:Hypothetical predicted protein [Olea europaea subsp. europaea]
MDCCSDHGDDSSLSGQREIDEILGSDTEPDKLSKRDFCIKKVPLAVKMKKGRKSVIDTSASEVIDTNNDAIARTRRRKV